MTPFRILLIVGLVAPAHLGHAASPKATVFAHYTTWYSMGEAQDSRSWPPDELAGRLLYPMPRYPLLNDEGKAAFGFNHGFGGYDGTAAANIQQHIAWAKEYGIDVFAFLWNGPDSRFTPGIEAFRTVNTGQSWIIFYDTNIRFAGLGICTNSNPLSATQPCLYDLNQKIRDKGTVKTVGDAMVEDFKQLKLNGWIDDPNYFRADGRPVIWIYQAFLFTDESAAQPGARRWTDYIDDIRLWYWQKYHIELFLVGNLAGPGRHYSSEWDSHITRFDGVSGWSPYYSNCARDATCDCCRPRAITDVVAPVIRGWADAVPSLRVPRVSGGDSAVEFAPFLTPQFDDQWTKGSGRPRMVATSKDDFRYMATKLGRDLLRGRDWVFLATFNAWPEGTTVEPTCDWKSRDCSADYTHDRGLYGFDFLEVIREVFGGAD